MTVLENKRGCTSMHCKTMPYTNYCRFVSAMHVAPVMIKKKAGLSRTRCALGAKCATSSCQN